MPATEVDPETTYLLVGVVPRGLPFENGDTLDQPTFHRLYLTTPEGVKAELIDGVVHLASPVSVRHGRPHSRAVQWLGGYADETPGTEMFTDTSNILGEKSEPQPDVSLRILQEYGGQSFVNRDGYVEGPSEFVVEVASTTANVDLHAKHRDYERAGVKEYVVVLSAPERVVWFTRGRKGFTEFHPGDDGIFRSTVFPGLWLDPVALFHATGRRILSVLQSGLASPEHAAFVAKLAARAAKSKPRKPKS